MAYSLISPCQAGTEGGRGIAVPILDLSAIREGQGFCLFIYMYLFLCLIVCCVEDNITLAYILFFHVCIRLQLTISLFMIGTDTLIYVL
jgi:hypothetical protein